MLLCATRPLNAAVSGLVRSCYTHLGAWGSERRGAGCGVLDEHVHCVVEHASWVDVVARTLLMVVVL